LRARTPSCACESLSLSLCVVRLPPSHLHPPPFSPPRRHFYYNLGSDPEDVADKTYPIHHSNLKDFVVDKAARAAAMTESKAAEKDKRAAAGQRLAQARAEKKAAAAAAAAGQDE